MFTRKAMEIEDLEAHLRRLKRKGWTYDQVVNELSKPKYNVDADALGSAIVVVYGPYPKSVKEPSASRVVQLWLQKQAQPKEKGKDKPEEGEGKEAPPQKKKDDKEPVAPPEQDPAIDELQEEQEAREAMQPYSDLLMSTAKRLRALSIPNFEISVNRNEVTHTIRVEASTPSGKQTYVELGPTKNGIAVKSRDFEKDGLLGSERPFEGDLVKPEELDSLLGSYYEAWSKQTVPEQ